LKVVSVLLLFGALGTHPYSYYQNLRLVVTITAVFEGWLSHTNNKKEWVWTFLVIGIVFNPIFPIYLPRGLWVIIDVVVGVVMIYSFLLSKRAVKFKESRDGG